MSATISLELTVNGEKIRADVPMRRNLADFLRETLFLTGTHVGCEQGVCGACTVRLDGEIVRGCLVLAAQAQGRVVETIEGVSDTGEIADLQAAFETRNALQCGYCTPGMLLTAQELLTREPAPQPRSDPRIHLGQLLSLHGLSGDRRRHRDDGARAQGSEIVTASDKSGEGLSALDRPNSYIGRSVPRPNLARLLQGRGRYVSDISLPRMAHVVYVRSPFAHARILRIDKEAARAMPGVIAVVTGPELAEVCTPWVGVLSHLAGLKSAPQYAMAIDRACWMGEAVAAIVATTRAEAEDAAERLQVDYEELAPVVDMEAALNPETPVIHPDLGDNLAFERKLNAGDVDAAFADADAVAETTFHFGRHTGVTLEPRSIVADYNPGDGRLTVHQGTQAPHMMQNIFAKHLSLREDQVRVICNDVGGSFGIKVHVYADDMATVALSKLLRRPIKYVADRVEFFVTDIHARDHRVAAASP